MSSTACLTRGSAMTEQAVPPAPSRPNRDFGALKDKEPHKPPRSQWKDVWDQFRKHKGAVFGGGFLMFITLAVICSAPGSGHVDPKALDIRNKDLRPIYTLFWDSRRQGRLGASLRHRPPGPRYPGADDRWRARVHGRWLGGDDSGAADRHRRSACCAGYFKRLDGLLMRFTDLVLSLPILPLLLVAVTLFRQPLMRRFGPEGGHVHPDRGRHRPDLVDANRADRARRHSGAEGTRVHSGGPVHRHDPVARSSGVICCPT